jgi:hypothetical protein
MGTNYYLEYSTCPWCGHGERLHIGKSGTMVQGYKMSEYDREWQPKVEPFNTFGEILGWPDWRRILTRRRLPFFWRNRFRVVDEYGKRWRPRDLVALFERSSPEARARQHDAYTGTTERSWLDAEGFSVMTGDWS